jgi:hypothetical protein
MNVKFITFPYLDCCLTLILLTWTKWWAPASASKWQMGFNLAFKVLRELHDNPYKRYYTH